MYSRSRTKSNIISIRKECLFVYTIMEKELSAYFGFRGPERARYLALSTFSPYKRNWIFASSFSLSLFALIIFPTHGDTLHSLINDIRGVFPRCYVRLHSNPVITNHSGERPNIRYKRDSLYPGGSTNEMKPFLLSKFAKNAQLFGRPTWIFQKIWVMHMVEKHRVSWLQWYQF